MANDERAKNLYELIIELSQVETIEIEITVAIFQKSVQLCIEKYIEYYVKEFSQACLKYRKDEKSAIKTKEEILGKYEKEFNIIVERIEEQFINLIDKLEEILEREKMLIVKFNEALDIYSKAQNDIEIMDNCIVLYNYYSAIENECRKMIHDCIMSTPLCIKNILKTETEKIAIKEKMNIFQRVKMFFKSIIISNKFEKEYVEIKQKSILQIEENVKIEANNIRNTTIDYLRTIIAYQKRIDDKTIA